MPPRGWRRGTDGKFHPPSYPKMKINELDDEFSTSYESSLAVLFILAFVFIIGFIIGWLI